MATNVFGGPLPWLQEVNKTGNYSVLATDVGTLFTTGGGGAITFTLPALAAANINIAWWFFNLQGQNMVITAPANKLVAFNNATATNATYSTAGNLIGAFAMAWLNQAGTFYYFANLSPNTVTIS